MKKAMCKLAFILCVCSCHTYSQDSAIIDKLNSLPNKYFLQVSAKVDALDKKFDQTAKKSLQKFLSQQDKIVRELYKIDSAVARNIAVEGKRRYAEMQAKLENPQSLGQYIPYFDSLQTSLKFLDSYKDKLRQ